MKNKMAIIVDAHGFRVLPQKWDLGINIWIYTGLDLCPQNNVTLVVA